MKISNSLSCCLSSKTKWIYDGMATMWTVRPWETYLDWFIELLRYIILPDNANAISVDTMMDICSEKVPKERDNKERSQPAPRVHVLNLHQGGSWQHFLSNRDNKNNLMSIFPRICEITRK